MLLLCTRYLYAQASSPFSYTLIGSLSDDPGFARPDWILSSIVQVFVETVHVVRIWSFSLPILVFLPFFI